MIQVKQCTIAWYVDNNKILHGDPNVVTMIIEKMEYIFYKMSVIRGREYNYLGMNVTFTKDIKAKISMKSYLKE
jgi:hypothetical protein